jgi:diaminohydroxyphosphoribosylaminopyrimidine deaminase/5-amino-6-(5-phosphoribosylamino)uracil reductase
MSAATAKPGSDPATDARFMAIALALGRRALGRTAPNPAVGAVVVKDGVIVGRGLTQPGGRPHAETEALQRAGETARGATLYVSLEPCSHHGRTPPCADAIIAAGIARVVSALEDPNSLVAGQGHARLIANSVAVTVGVAADEARRAHAGHIRRVCDGRPHLTLKLAVSSDGKVGLAGRRPAAITGEAVRAQVHLMRAMSDAILIGIGTALADDPALTCRLPGMEGRSPVRVVLDRNLRLPPASVLARTASAIPVWVVTTGAGPAAAERALRAQGVEVFRMNGALHLPSALKLIAARGITRLMVEGGPTVAAALLQADLIDEAVLFRAPAAIGPGGVDALEGLPLASLTHSSRLKCLGSAPIGTDTVEHYERV